MATRGRSARLKGHNFEREMANRLTSDTGFSFKRGLSQTRGGSEEVADLVCDQLPSLHFECKRGKRCNIKAAYAQAKDAVLDEMPIIITKEDRQPTFVTMAYEDWIILFKGWCHDRNIVPVETPS